MMEPRAEYIWIIGASAGIGRALAQVLASEGHHIALSARNADALGKLHDDLGKRDQHIVIPVDVESFEVVCVARDQILSRWSRIDRVVFMAGIYTPMKLGALDLRQMRKILDVNLLGAFHTVEAILPVFFQQSYGQIALCASVAGYRGLPQSQPYGASKAGLINLAESLRAEHGRIIDIKLINPGFVETRLTDKNDFTMPAKITADEAARVIAGGLKKSAFEIHFPKRFTLIMKLFRLIPYWMDRMITG